MIFWMMLGCTLSGHQMGLIKTERSAVQLSTIEGKQFMLYLGADKKYIQHLDGCQLKVEGVQLHRHFWVQKWKVTDGGDGSAPFIGILERKGIQFFINDINSGSTVLLEKVGKLSEHVGKPVLVVGVVIGSHQVKVMSWRLLDITN